MLKSKGDYIKKLRTEIFNHEQHFFSFAYKGRIKTLKRLLIQATEEGDRRDVLTPDVTVSSESTGLIDENNYPTYSAQVNDINEMYNNRTSYGGEFLRPVLDTRVAFLIGEGITIKSSNDGTIKWINEFLDFNRLRGSKLLNSVLTGEMEGKCLWVVFPEKDKSTTAEEKKGNIRVRIYQYYKTPYEVEMDEKNSDIIKQVTYQKNNQDAKNETVKSDRAVYIKLGGSPDRINRTVPKIANVLTDIENASRTKYDLRKNNHLFGRVTPYFKTQTSSEAKSLYNKILATVWRVGRAFAGTAEFSLVEPTGNATNALTKELIVNMKHISLNTGIPIQWLAYPELLSNRATAENMIEMINGATIRERTIWQEAITDLIRKSMEIAMLKGWIKTSAYKPDDFIIEIPQVSIALLEQIASVWVPLAEAGYISKDTVRGKVPGIDPSKEKALVEEEKEEAMERFNQGLLGKNAIGNAMMQNNEKGEEKNGEKENEQTTQQEAIAK